MLVDYEKFEGLLPYASGLFGIYQPLVGWRAERMKRRFESRRRVRDGLISYLFHKIRPDVRIGRIDNRGIEIQQLGIGSGSLPYRASVPAIIDSRIARSVLDSINAQDPALTPETIDWEDFLDTSVLNTELDRIRHELAAPSGMAPQNFAARKRAADRESSVAGILSFLYQEEMFSVLNEMFFPQQHAPHLEPYNAMIALFGAGESEEEDLTGIAMSPIGVIHLYRQYFFEFDSFLGPSVQHVWLSPGATVELVETHSRTVTTERFVEVSSESTQRTEESLTINDEFSDAIKNENSNNTKLGVSASVDGGFGNAAFSAHAAFSASFGYDTNEKKSREQLHKQTRAQSSKLSTEIKRNYKTSLRVVTETTDTSSKRYVLTNDTSELVNYELRRKMRQVGVQLQDVGTQLCWQTYVDEPGRELGIAELVHIAEPADLSLLPVPEAPPKLEALVSELDVVFPYENRTGGDDKDVVYYEGNDKETFTNDQIVWQRDYRADPPQHGYTLDEDIQTTCVHSNTCVVEAKAIDKIGNFRLSLIQVNFDDLAAINIKVKLRWNPPDSAVADKLFQESMATYNQEKSRMAKEAFVKAARERVRLASGIQPRDSTVLREEERIIVYRALIGELLDVGVDLENARIRHIMSEVVSILFDIDKMLYFVAPEWWRPRAHRHAHNQSIGESDGAHEHDKVPVERITEEHVVGWGGVGAKGRESNYYITEDSVPAKLGSSLGWILQLDGDTMRNAFLNAPWVKAILPIRQGREFDALDWLKSAAVEGTEGLDELYQEEVAGEKDAMVTILTGYTWTDSADIARYDGSFTAAMVTIEDALKAYMIKLMVKYNASKTLVVDGDEHYMPTDKLFDYGFDPTDVDGGFRATPSSEDPFEVFDQWVEVLPTDQLVAVQVEYDPVTGRLVEPEPEPEP